MLSYTLLKMASSMATSCPRHIDLHLVAISHGFRNQNPVSRNSASSEPGIMTTREFYRNHVVLVPGIYEVDDHHPRRHSVMATPRGLTTGMRSITISSSGLKLLGVPERADAQPKSAEKRQDAVPSRDKQNELTGVGTAATWRQSSDASWFNACILCPITFQYAHDHLRTLGHTYLGNTATADAFVNATHLCRPSMTLVEGGSGDCNGSSKHTTVRARVIPKDIDRKPFLIQKQFDIEDLRSGIPPLENQSTSQEFTNSVTLRRSCRIRQSTSRTAQQMPSPDRRRASTGTTVGRDLTSLGSSALPIHVKYALHYLPVLAALMLSGHVRKGDSIDLPLPHPEAWREVVSYIYTGEGLITVAVKENILFLAGRAD